MDAASKTIGLHRVWGAGAWCAMAVRKRRREEVLPMPIAWIRSDTDVSIDRVMALGNGMRRPPFDIPVQKIVENLAHLANERDGTDNISLLLIKL